MLKRIGLFVIEFLKIAFTIFIMSWVITIPTIAAAFMIGYMVPYVFALWLLLALGVVCLVLIPLGPGAARGGEAIIYFALPLVVPLLVLVPYFVGCLLR